MGTVACEVLVHTLTTFVILHKYRNENMNSVACNDALFERIGSFLIIILTLTLKNAIVYIRALLSLDWSSQS
jgi:hypothetical protein